MRTQRYETLGYGCIVVVTLRSAGTLVLIRKLRRKASENISIIVVGDGEDLLLVRYLLLLSQDGLVPCCRMDGW